MKKRARPMPEPTRWKKYSLHAIDSSLAQYFINEYRGVSYPKPVSFAASNRETPRAALESPSLSVKNCTRSEGDCRQNAGEAI
jgi:hypothetical protein